MYSAEQTLPIDNSEKNNSDDCHRDMTILLYISTEYCLYWFEFSRWFHWIIIRLHSQQRQSHEVQQYLQTNHQIYQNTLTNINGKVKSSTKFANRLTRKHLLWVDQIGQVRFNWSDQQRILTWMSRAHAMLIKVTVVTSSMNWFVCTYMRWWKK
jgi:hypothetical protein